MEESDDEIIHLYMDSDYIVFRLLLILTVTIIVIFGMT